MLTIECPYCHKKFEVKRTQLMLRGRNGVVCPACRHYVFHVLRKRLLVLQGVMGIVAVMLCAGLGQSSVPGGFLGKLAALLGSLALVMVLGELGAAWITRPSLLRAQVERAARQAKAEQAAQRSANRKKKKKK